MRRADRLFQIVQYLRGGRLTTARMLAERLEVSERTIYRDVADLIGSGVPIDGAAGVGYLMRAGYDLPPLMFTRDEIAALTAGARMVRSFGGAEMALAAEEALQKIEAVLPEALRAHTAAVAIDASDAGALSDNDRAMIDRLDRFGDTASADVLRVIYEDEIGHVAIGKRWFDWLCDRRGLAPGPTWRDLVRRHFKGTLKPPFNEDARAAAGFPVAYLDSVGDVRK